MAPSGKGRNMRKPRRTHYAKTHVESTEFCAKSSNKDAGGESSKTGGTDSYDVVDDDISNKGCSTPRAQRFQIPRIQTCPPAPKKRRIASNCLSQRSPVPFFAPPDLDLFFFVALRDISV